MTTDAVAKRTYGLTHEQNKKLHDAWDHCVLCRKPFSRTRLRALDHDHSDGLLRGVPCVQCNDRLGYLHDDAGWLSRAAHYLSYPPAVAVIGIHYVPGSLGAARQEL